MKLFILIAMVVSSSLTFASDKSSKRTQKAPPPPKVNFDEETQAAAATHASVKHTDDPVPYPNEELEKMDAAKQQGGDPENSN